MVKVTYCRSARSLKSMPMYRLPCPEEKAGLASGATARVGAKAKAKGANRTTAAEATVTNESLIVFVLLFESDVVENKMNEYGSMKNTLQHVRVPQLLIQLPVLVGF